MSIAKMSSVKLAINGGNPAIPAGTVKIWPPIDDTDRKMVPRWRAGTMPTAPTARPFRRNLPHGTATSSL